ncbi:hypothetical protein GOBAR_DD14525 [Gossypium barbadense]|nr:hypothetical protein GOBAR_DD14525 [Gossypium barbadense]
MEKLVDVVHLLHLEIHEAFGSAGGDKPVKASVSSHKKLGSAGLALHYANIITQIDTLSFLGTCEPYIQGDSLAILKAELKSQKKHVRSLKKKSLWSRILEEVSRSSSVPPNTRDSLYQGLPPTVKSALWSRLQSFQIKEELTVPQIKAEMEKTLQWLVPIATNTTKHGWDTFSAVFRMKLLPPSFYSSKCIFQLLILVSIGINLFQLELIMGLAGLENGQVLAFMNKIFRSEVNHKPAGQTDLLRIETLHHADKEKTEVYILDLVVWLHHLVTQVRACNGGIRSPVKSPIRSPNQKMVQLTQKPTSPMLTVEDQEMLRDVSKRKNTPGISKSQEFDTAKTRLSKHHRLSKSSNHSPTSETKKDPFPIRRLSSVPFIDFDIDRIKALDVIDRVDTLRSS